MVICGSVFFQRWTLKSQKFVCLLLLRCPAVSLPLHRTYQTWEILWFCLLRVRWEKYWKKNSRHTVWEQIDGHIRLLTFLPDIISCLQWGLILSFLQLQFQFVTCRPEILQPTILELRKLDLYFQTLSNIPGSYFKYLFFFIPLWCLKTPPRFPQHSLSPDFSIKSTRKGKEPLNYTWLMWIWELATKPILPLQ